MRKRSLATTVVAICAVAGLVAGLLVFRPPGPDAPPIPAVEAGVEVGDRLAGEGWTLMASQEVADRTPPEEVVDCRGLHAWALREGALPTGDVVHTITFSADRRTTVEGVRVRVVPDPTPYSGDGREDTPVVRLVCRPEADATPPFPDPGTVRLRVDANAPPVTFDAPRVVGPGTDAGLDVVVALSGTTGPFAYRVEVGVVEGGGFRVVPVNGGDDVLFATEDGGGMGYWPATTTWTMSPTRTRTRCPAVVDPGLDQEVECS